MKGKISRAQRRMLELERRRKKRRIAISAILIAVLIPGIYFAVFSRESGEVAETQSSLTQTEEEVLIPLSQITSKAKFFSYDAEGVPIRYFAVMGSDGKVHVAIDACDVCYHEKKGYRQIGEVMHCINCGREFPINSIGTENVAGGCWPSYIPIKIEEDNIVIKKIDLEKPRYMFS